MARITVYPFELYDPVKRTWARIDGSYGTVEAIERRGGVALRLLGIEVDERAVGPTGFVDGGDDS